MTTANEAAQAVFDELCADPEVWATHGMPGTAKEQKIVAAIARALQSAPRAVPHVGPVFIPQSMFDAACREVNVRQPAVALTIDGIEYRPAKPIPAAPEAPLPGQSDVEALRGLVGLVELLLCRDDLPAEVREVLATNHRVIEGYNVLSKDRPSLQTDKPAITIFTGDPNDQY